MATKLDMMEKYTVQLKELGVEAEPELLTWITDRVGPANYDSDGQLVAATQPAELGRVFTGFVGDELAEEDEEKGMAAIQEVCDQMKDINKKYRAVVYYLLAKKYGK
jgi:hypothetical protein